MTLDILRRSGGWCVELQQPLKHLGKDVTAIEIRAPTADHAIRWGQEKIPSTLALLSELCDLPEKLLRQVSAFDFERVMFALINVLPSSIKSDLEHPTRPLATPEEEMTETAKVPAEDQINPLFPTVEGPVHRMTMKPKSVPDEDQPMNAAGPAVMEAVR